MGNKNAVGWGWKEEGSLACATVMIKHNLVSGEEKGRCQCVLRESSGQGGEGLISHSTAPAVLQH